MKQIIISILAVLSFLCCAEAQVQIKPLPKPGFEKRIMNYTDQMKVVDTHEHLGNLQNIQGWRYKCKKLDFMFLFFVYTCDDLISAGLQERIFNNKLMTDSLTVMEKWRMIKPYWEGSSNTAYNRAVLLAADKLFGVKNIDSTTVEELSEKIRIKYKDPDGWFYHVLKEKCGIEYVVLDWDRSFGDPKIFRYVTRFDGYVDINSKESIENLLNGGNTKDKTLDNLESALENAFHGAMKEGIVAIKSALAYNRILFYDDVSKEKAREVFNRIMNSPSGTMFSFSEVKPLQDYMMHRVLYLASTNHIPVQIHTGLQGNNGNIIENSKPTHLANLFLKYPNVKFILFHGGYPFGGELGTLAKNFPNVYIDMCWVYIISPSYSERYLLEWLETVPSSKIMAFGGDYMNVEGVYSQLLFAKQIISNVLIAKVREGYFTEEEAIKIAQMILHDNALRILNLK
jgi:uncharacterized protein